MVNSTTKGASICNEEKTATSTNGIGKLKAICRRMNFDHFVTVHKKLNSKEITELDVRPETIKLLDEIIAIFLLTMDLAICFFGYVSSCKGNKSKNKWNYIKLKSFFIARGIINNTKRLSTEQEKIFANVISKK